MEIVLSMKHYELYLGNYDAMKTVELKADSHRETDTHLILSVGQDDDKEMCAKFKLDTVLGWAITK